MLRAVLFVLFLTLGHRATAADTRTAFLALLQRPRVPLAADIRGVQARKGVEETAFSFASEAGERVPGLAVRRSADARPGRRAAVIVLHGTGGNKEGQRALLDELAGLGFVAVAIDGRHHGARARGGPGAKSADYVAAIGERYRTGRGLPFFYDTVWDVLRLIDLLETFPDVDPRRIGLIGFSKGGIETYLAAAADPRVAVAVPCIGVQSFRWAVEHGAWRSRIETVQAAFDGAARAAGVADPGPDFVRTFYARVAPGLDGDFDGPAMLPLIAPRPLLCINGAIDPRTPRPGVELCATAAREAYATAGAAARFEVHFQPDTAHKVTAAGHELARAWLVRWLRP
jgi:dienelactone hydrolase